MSYYCSRCGSPVDPSTGRCPVCDGKKEGAGKNIIIAVLIVVLALLICAIILVTALRKNRDDKAPVFDASAAAETQIFDEAGETADVSAGQQTENAAGKKTGQTGEKQTEKPAGSDISPLSYEMREEYFEYYAEDGTLFYYSKIEYPYFFGSSAGEEAINDYYAGLIEKMRKTVEESDESNESWYLSSSEDLHLMLPYYRSFISTVFYNKNGYISVRYTEVEWQGAAHPYSWYGVLNYEVESGRELTLDDVLKGSEYAVEQAAADAVYEAYGQQPRSRDWYKEAIFSLYDEGLCIYYWIGDAVKNVEAVIPYDSGDTPVIHLD